MAGRFTAAEVCAGVHGSFDPRFSWPEAIASPGAPAAKQLSVPVSTDTRTLSDGEIFFAFSGGNFDAHDHLDEAAAKGASVLVISAPEKIPAELTAVFRGSVILVGDTLRAYQDLAAYYRNKIDPYVIAVTGSVGKTTLKDMIACLVKDKYRTAATQGNYNNQIGVPKTILDMPEDTEVLVLELGMGGPGEIVRLAEIARPDAAAITNIGLSHRECFDSDEGVMLEKLAIASQMSEGDLLAIDRENHPPLTQRARAKSEVHGYRLLEVSAKRSCRDSDHGQDQDPALRDADYSYGTVHIEADTAEASFEIESGGNDGNDKNGAVTARFLVPVPGDYAAVQAALACAAVSRLGIGLTEAAAALRELARTPHRLQLIQKDGILVIDDTYNASPDSMHSGLMFLTSVPALRRIAVLADMKELGPESESLHRALGREIGTGLSAGQINVLVCYGEKARAIAEGAAETSEARGTKETKGQVLCLAGSRQIRIYENQEEMIADLLAGMETGDVYLVKGSHSMHMEAVANALLGQDGQGGQETEV